MKNFILLSWLLFLSQAAFSQDGWAPLGARWWYTEYFFGDYLPFRYEVVGQQEIEGKNCQAIFETGFWGDSPIFHGYEEAGQVWLYSVADSSFHLRYDFNLPQGGAWQTPYGGDTLTFVVDTVRWEFHSGQTWKVQDLSIYRPGCPDCVEFESVIEGIGSKKFHAFPFPTGLSADIVYYINCYDELDSEVISFGGTLDCDALATPAFERKNKEHALLKTYPNPVKNVLRFGFVDHAAPSGAAHFRILNALGQVIVKVEADRFVPTMTVSVEGWTKGLYFLQYLEGGEVRQTETFIKQ